MSTTPRGREQIQKLPQPQVPHPAESAVAGAAALTRAARADSGCSGQHGGSRLAPLTVHTEASSDPASWGTFLGETRSDRTRLP